MILNGDYHGGAIKDSERSQPVENGDRAIDELGVYECVLKHIPVAPTFPLICQGCITVHQVLRKERGLGSRNLTFQFL